MAIYNILNKKRDEEFSTHEREQASTKLLNLCSDHKVLFFKNPMRSIDRHVRKLGPESLFVSKFCDPESLNHHLDFKPNKFLV